MRILIRRTSDDRESIRSRDENRINIELKKEGI
jgi:hypothetical protein